MEIGDSLGNDLGWGLARHVDPSSGLNLVQLDKSSTGLAHPSFYNWPAQLAAALPQYRPQLVVIFLGGNDQQGMDVHGSAVQFGTAAWTGAYINLVHQLAAEATDSGAFVLWVGMPVMRQPEYSEGMQVLNADYQAGLMGLPGARFLSTWALFAEPDGAFDADAFVNGARMGLREPDGIHFSFAGEDVLATYVLGQIAAVYHVHLAATNPAVITGWS